MAYLQNPLIQELEDRIQEAENKLQYDRSENFDRVSLLKIQESNQELLNNLTQENDDEE